MIKKKIIPILLISLFIAFVFSYKTLFTKNETITLNGNVEIQDVNISFRVSGRIKKINVDEGHYIKKGDILAVLDADSLNAKVSFAKAKLKEAEFTLLNNEKELSRNKLLLQKNSVSEKVFDDSQAKYEVSKALYEAAKSDLTLSEINLNDATLTSPINGTILNKNIEIGEMITSGVPVFSIMPDEYPKIKTFANEAVLTKIKYSDSVLIHTESNPEKTFKGHIGFISSEAEFTPKNIETAELRTTLVYRVRVIVDEPAPELKQGMPVKIQYPNQK